MRPRPLIIFLFSATLSTILWSCPSQKGPSYPTLDHLDLSFKIVKGAEHRYRAKYIFESPVDGAASSSRNLSLTWMQTAAEVRPDGSAVMECRIEDALIETEGAAPAPTPGGIGSIIRNTLAGRVYAFEVTAKGHVTETTGAEIDWQESFQSYFDEEKIDETLQDFIVERIELYFSREQVFSTLTLPFRLLPGKPVSEGSRWEEKRNVAVFGINAHTAVTMQAEGFEDVMDRTALAINMKTDWLSGAATMVVPHPTMPVIMEVTITGGSMEGRLFVDPDSGTVLACEERYSISMEARSGLPSLKPGQKIDKNAPLIKMKADFTVKLSHLD